MWTRMLPGWVEEGLDNAQYGGFSDINLQSDPALYNLWALGFSDINLQSDNSFMWMGDKVVWAIA